MSSIPIIALGAGILYLYAAVTNWEWFFGSNPMRYLEDRVFKTRTSARTSIAVIALIFFAMALFEFI